MRCDSWKTRPSRIGPILGPSLLAAGDQEPPPLQRAQIQRLALSHYQSAPGCDYDEQERIVSGNPPAHSDPAPTSGRQDREAPPAIAAHGWRFHHIGIPTKTPRTGERYLASFKMYVSGFESSPYGVEWMRFDADSPLPEIVKSLPHVAFEVDDRILIRHSKEGKS